MTKRILGILLATGLAGCAPSVQPGSPSSLTDVAYKLDGKLPMVPVRINGAGPYWFIIDSGASRTVLDTKLVEELGLQVTGHGTTTGTGTGAVPLTYVGKVSVGLGSVSYDSEPYVIDLSQAPLSKEVRGLVGSEIFKSHRVRLDPERQRIEIFDPRSSPPRNAGAAIPLTVEGGKLFMPATLDVRPGRRVGRQLRIDTGSESSVNDPSAAEAEFTATTTLGGGLGASFEGVSGKFNAVHLGPYTIKDVWGPGGSPSAIGMELLQRFVVTFDAPRGQIYLQPTGRVHKAVPHPPGEVKRTGRQG